MSHTTMFIAAAFLLASAPRTALAQSDTSAGPNPDQLRAEIAAALDDVPAIDNHTHLVYGAAYDARYVGFMPLVMRQDMALYTDLTETLFGTRDPEEAAKLRDARVAAEAGAYWAAHLDATRTEIALVNTMRPFDDADGRLIPVPFASYLLFPVPADAYPLHPEAAAASQRARDWLKARSAETGAELPDLESYLAFADATLASWAEDGAVAVKFTEGLSRSLLFAEVGVDEAEALYARGLENPLSRQDYLSLQDHIARRLFHAAPGHGLAVHIHVGAGNPPFLRLGDNAVAHLETILGDPRFFGTQFVLIHGGFPEVEAAAYQSLRPNVWIDLSAQAHFVPLNELAENIRTYLSYSPQSVLFGTDVSSFPSVPGGPEVQHHVVSARMREALTHALGEMVANREIGMGEAIEMGIGVLRGNAERLYGFGG